MLKSDILVPSGAVTLKAFLARPEGAGPYPALVVIHEIVGLTDHIKEITCRLAEEGYAALAIDLFSPGNTAICIWKCLAAVRTGKTDHFGVHYLQSGLDYLARQPWADPGRLGAIGFCMGGNFATSLACEDKRVKTIAPFYGLTPAKAELNKLCPLVGSYPEKDLTRKSGEELNATLNKCGIDHDIKIYPGARHCFLNESLPFLYNDEAAKDSWKRTMDFFDRYLGAKSSST
ncbi:MAG: dienelactone hydrolase family protein [Cyanobacteria bacterium SZAS TMP-1]|nr:dienelactone hydrolase family protein [Cyanobacteria bacterium SZAS TMP-1]